MRYVKALFRFFKRLFWAIAVAYMVAWHNVYKEDDKILHQVVITMEEEKDGDQAGAATGDTEELVL